MINSAVLFYHLVRDLKYLTDVTAIRNAGQSADMTTQPRRSERIRKARENKLATLPTELLSMLFKFMEQPDLLNLALTDRWCHSLAQPRLYQTGIFQYNIIHTLVNLRERRW